MQNSYKQLFSQVEANTRKMYETVGDPAPNTATVLNSAETAVGFFANRSGSSEPASAPQEKKEI